MARATVGPDPSLPPPRVLLPTPQAEIGSDRDHFPLDGITSVALTQNSVSNPPEAATTLVGRAVQEAIGDRRKTPADLVIILDDLELANAHQPSVVLDVVRSAAEVHVQGLGNPNHQAKARGALKDKISFHLVVPMVEAWFFGDPAALARAGVLANPAPQIPPGTDLEAFRTNDEAYGAASAEDCPGWAAQRKSQRKNLRPKWLGASDRTRHPKGYLQWPTRDPGAKGCTRYSETKSGFPALAGLDRSAVFTGRPQGHLSYLRALIEDLEDGLGTNAAGHPFTPTAAPLTSRHNLPSTPILRNL